MGDYHGPVFSNEIDKLRDERDVLHYENWLLRCSAASLLTDNEALSAEVEQLRAALRTETADHSRTQQLLASRVGKENATLRAEHGWLRSISKFARAHTKALEEDNEALRAEVERLTKANSNLISQAEESAFNATEITDWRIERIAEMGYEAARLRAEIEQLREKCKALERGGAL